MPRDPRTAEKERPARRPLGRSAWFLRAYGRAIWGHRSEIGVLSLLVLAFTMVSAAAMYLVERGAGTFSSYWDAFYWAGITVTTVGYGDLTPATTAGQAVALLTSFIGAGFLLVTAGLVAVFFARVMEE